MNFGIDEFVSPRLRSSGSDRVRTRRGRKVHMRIGFTPVVIDETTLPEGARP